ncbi:TetR family transcriptional regulator [Streptomyces sp. NPDC050504]|uniref:TetR family transcriptional regulator n=1 Tax=Streptomyces sp. NPDC050504 TaxID=3365618 RepID=UPI00379E45E8
MAVQQRAERTRQGILAAAARVFDAYGYEGASLARIGAEAGVTTGALMFHFRTKADLADAVRQHARAVTQKAVETAGGDGTAVRKLVAATRALVRLFETDEVARVGERLARDLGPAGTGTDQECPWRREVTRLIRYAAAEGALRPGTDAAAVAALVSYIVTGVELAIRRPAAPADEPWLGETGALDGSAEERLERIWDLLLPALEV